MQGPSVEDTSKGFHSSVGQESIPQVCNVVVGNCDDVAQFLERGEGSKKVIRPCLNGAQQVQLHHIQVVR